MVLDTLRATRRYRLAGHLVGLLAYGLLIGLESGGQLLLTWGPGLMLIPALLVVELVLSLVDGRTRRATELAPAAYPFGALGPVEREQLQSTLATAPDRAVWRSLAAWTLAAVLLKPFGVSWSGVALLLGLGALPGALTQGLANALRLRRVLPFFHADGEADQMLGRWLPSSSARFYFSVVTPLLVTVPPLALMSVLRLEPGLGFVLAAGGLGLAFALAVAASLGALVTAPLSDLGQALDSLGQGDLDVHLDVVSGDAVGRVSQAFNRALSAVRDRQRRLRRFGQALRPGQSPADLDAVTMEGEARSVAAMAVRWLDQETVLAPLDPRARLAALGRFYETVQDAVDRHQGSTLDLGQGSVIAVWGATGAGTEGLQGALGAAWDLQRSLAVVAQQLKLRLGLQLTWGLGLAAGEATVGLSGPRGRERFQVLGLPVDVARRLAGNSGGAWVDPRIATAVPAPFAVQALESGPRLVAGPEVAVPSASDLGFAPGERL